jgi:hypothetical protein
MQRKQDRINRMNGMKKYILQILSSCQKYCKQPQF